jgi:CHAT domain-containing protein
MADVKAIARVLDEKLMLPVRELLGETRKILLSPDGLLNLIPFAALVDESNSYLVERYSFTYLTTGRDLLQLGKTRQRGEGMIIFADPDFGEMVTLGLGRKPKVSSPSIDFSSAYFGSLPSTHREAQALKAVFPDATVLNREQATETAVKQVASPNILHLATHGFFLEDVIITAKTNSRDLVMKAEQPIPSSLRIENPLLRSGLAFAGANLRRSGKDDGILTALEASGIDLSGTKLVVLSACDTGLGEVRNGQGVYGLRRAFALAGAESLIMSLWEVSDEATSDLMTDYYKILQTGQGRGEALRQAQLRMLVNKEQEHPYYWASFIQSGQWYGININR